MKKVIHVDLDDTLCHYTDHHKVMKGRNPEIKYPQSQYGFFLEIPPIQDGKHYLDDLSKHFEVYILTRPSFKNPLCYTEKRYWVEKHLGMYYAERLFICPNKSLVKGDYLVDDTLWPNFEGEQIQFGTYPFTHWKYVYRYIMNINDLEPIR